MALNKAKKKIFLQLILLTIGILLVFFIYFSNPKIKKNQKVSDNPSKVEENIEYNKDINIFENLEYRGTDSSGNKFVIFSEYSDFRKDKPEIVNLRNILCYFYFQDDTILEIRSEIGTYNNVTLDMSFAKNVNMFYVDNSLISDKADFNNETNSLSIEGNVKTKSLDGELIADKLNFDFTDKKLKVSMYGNEEKVNVKTKMR